MGDLLLVNQNFNKLPRRSVSSNKNTGKIVDSINLSLITDSSNVVTDHCFEYYNSKFQFSDFFNKDIQPHSWISKPKFLLDSKGGSLYRTDEIGLELAYRHLVSLYQDLDTCLQRLYDGYHDSCFIRFAQKSGIFTTERHWQNLMRNWYLGFSMAMRRYYNACHHEYDPSTNLSYVTYFDTHFSNYLYYAIGRADQDHLHPAQFYNEKELEMIRLDQLNETSESISYGLDEYSSWLM